MTTLGTGLVPGGQQGTELSAVTRRAFLPRLIVQIYQASPLMTAMIGNANTAMGGISSVTVPVQYSNMVTSQWSDFSATFAQPSYQAGIQNMELNLALMITPIPFLGTEALVQDAHAVIPRIEAVMNDATNNATDTMATALYNNYSNTSQIIGLPGAVDDGTNLVTYGGINRTANTWFKSKVKSWGAVAPTRTNVMQSIAGVFGGTTSGTATTGGASEMPNFGVMGVATWMELAKDFISNEAFPIYPDGKGFDQQPQGPRSGFTALVVAGVPIFADPYCPEQALYLINTNYLNLYMHHMAMFAFTGFYSTMPNWQVGYIAAVLNVLQLVNTKPKSCGRFAMTSVTSL
jgi:hypothetical protein